MRQQQLLCGLLGVLALIAGCEASSQPATQEPRQTDPGDRAAETALVMIDFDQTTAEFETLLPEVVNSGVATVRTEIVTAGGGRIRLAPDLGGGGAARFPAYASEGPAAAAALLLWDAGDGTDLSPGNRDFTFGATFSLDRASDGARGDNGDNLVQRGLFADEQQMKIQLDHGVPSCRVAGAEGEVFVEWTEAIARGTWFTLQCSRVGATVSLELTEVESRTSMGTVTVDGPTGALDFSSGPPLAVGAKVAADGVIPTSSSDQFNGFIDEVFFDVL